jgi:hypothetical protein
MSEMFTQLCIKLYLRGTQRRGVTAHCPLDVAKERLQLLGQRVDNHGNRRHAGRRPWQRRMAVWDGHVVGVAPLVRFSLDVGLVDHMVCIGANGGHKLRSEIASVATLTRRPGRARHPRRTGSWACAAAARTRPASGRRRSARAGAGRSPVFFFFFFFFFFLKKSNCVRRKQPAIKNS